VLNAAEIAHALRGRRSGKRWIVHCPAHQDKTPSCSVSEDSSGKILVHCFSGCRQQDVIEALRQKGLWPQKQQRSWTADEKRAWGKHHRKAERLGREAQFWYRVKLQNLESDKRYAFDRLEQGALEWRWSWIKRSRELFELASSGLDVGFSRFIEERRTSPRRTATLVKQGRQMAAEDLGFGSLIVAMLAIGAPRPHEC
jgi:rhodanese-related sulfurtransferase